MAINIKDDNYAQIINLDIKIPIIIPTGFDCGPSTMLRGSLDRPRKSQLSGYYNPDLPFDTVLLKEVTPIIDYFYDMKDKLTLASLADYFKDDTMQNNNKLKRNMLNVSFQHRENYHDKNVFESDMLIRIQNLLTVLKNKNQPMIFFRKSHSNCHHDNEYKYATDSIDEIKDTYNLCDFLSSIGIVNFKIILYLCCFKCHKSINIDLINSNPTIFCFKLLDVNTSNTSPIYKTTPAEFRTHVKELFNITKIKNLFAIPKPTLKLKHDSRSTSSKYTKHLPRSSSLSSSRTQKGKGYLSKSKTKHKSKLKSKTKFLKKT